jgi:hypothetical protein
MSDLIYTASGVVLFAIFVLMAYVIMTARADVNFTFLFAALGWTAVALIIFFATGVGNDPFKVMTNVFQNGPLTFATLTVWYLFIAIMGQCLIKTGVSEYIIRKATELGGGRPYIATVLVGLAVAYIFMGVGYNAGLAIIIYTITLPILQAYGFDHMDSAFLSSVAMYGGVSLAVQNFVGNFVYYPKMDQTMGHYIVFFYGQFAIYFALFLGYGLTQLWRTRRRRSWTVDTGTGVSAAAPASRLNVPWYSVFGPAIPVLLVMYGNWPIIPASIIGAFYPIIATQPRARRTFRQITDLWWAAVVDAFRDVTTVLMLFYTISMIMQAASEPVIVKAIGNVWGPLLPTTIIPLFIMLSVLVPLELYRGFIDPLGAGAALLAALRAIGSFNDNVLFAAYRGQSFSHTMADPTHSGNVWLQGSRGIQWNKFMRKYYAFIWGAAVVSVWWAYIAMQMGFMPGLK